MKVETSAPVETAAAAAVIAEPRRPRRDRDWDALAAVIAALVGLLALLVSGYTAYIQRQQVRAQVWPYLQLWTADNDFRIGVSNEGVGPARIEAVRVVVNGKVVRSWRDVFPLIDFPGDIQWGKSSFNHTVVAPGKNGTIIQVEKKAYDVLIGREGKHKVTIFACYCSVLDECWAESWGHPLPGAPPDHSPIEDCGVRPEEDFND